MKRVIYKHTGDIDKSTERMKILLYRSRERNRNILIGNAPVEVTDVEYEALKKGKHGKDIVLVTKATRFAVPLVHGVGKGKPLKAKKPKKEGIVKKVKKAIKKK